MKRILVYTFNVPRNNSYQLAQLLAGAGADLFLIGRTSDLLQLIARGNYEVIVGLGDYRRRIKYPRLETKFINRYGQHEILADGPESIRASFAPEVAGVRISSTATVGPCNRSAYRIAHLLESQQLTGKFGFLHVPKVTDIVLLFNELITKI